MGDNNTSEAETEAKARAKTETEEEVTPMSVSALFDDTLKKYFGVMRGEEASISEKAQKQISELIKKVEDLTRQVSVLGILSDNENYKEMNPSELKFILLPFMLGSLWQLSSSESRERICHLSKVYFRDYLKRCYNYEIISKLVPEAQSDEEEEEEDGEDKKKKKEPPKMASDDVREMKIQRFRETKMLDEKITLFFAKESKGEVLDEDDLQKYVVALLRRNVIEAEDQLRSISREMELITFAGNLRIGKVNPPPNGQPVPPNLYRPPPPSHSHQHQHPTKGKKDSKKKPPQIFILTKTQMEKQVFGAGYPAVPVMTVEELYEQRRKTGQWGPHSASSSSKLPDPTETEEDREAKEETLEEQDDEESLARRRQMDEYKDDHRRGWGNRYNRS